MSLLLRSVWRNALKSTSSFSIRSLSSSISELQTVKSPDAVTQQLRGARSTAAVLATVQRLLPTMDHRHMLQALRTIFQLHKEHRSREEAEELVKDPAFSTLCQNFKKHARALEINEVIEATKVLVFLHVPVDSQIVQTMLQLIRCNINFINTKQIMFLDFLLSRFDTKNHLVDALKLALPLVFQIQLPLELDHQDLPLLKDMLVYSCTHDLPDRCINNIVTGLLLHDQAIDAHAAKSIIWSLCDVNCTEERFPTRVQLLHICYDILTQKLDQLSYNDVLRIAAKIKGRVLEKHPEYYHEQLLDAVADYVVKNEVDFEKGLLIARVLSRIAHTNLGLIEYLCRKVIIEPFDLSNARTNILFSFINCLSNNNYVPEEDIWNEIQKQISANPVLDAKTAALPWTKVCLELASLGYYDDRLLEKVFAPQFLEMYLSREDNLLDLLQLMTLHEAVQTFHSSSFQLPAELGSRARALFPVHAHAAALGEALARGLGGPQYIATNVQLPTGVIADVVVCLKSGYPVEVEVPAVSGDTRVQLEDLNLPQDGIIVCVLGFSDGCYSANSARLRGSFRLVLDTLARRGLLPVPVRVAEWRAAPPHERAPALLREVAAHCHPLPLRAASTPTQ